VWQEEIIAPLNKAYIEAMPGDLIYRPIAARFVIAYLKSLRSVGMDNFRSRISTAASAGV
jgi:hypothetical protein